MLVAAIVFYDLQSAAFADKVPADVLNQLRSEQFSEREKAQKDLFDWVLKSGDKGVQALISFHTESDDPEVRSRCMEVLRQIALDEFASNGEGYIGINMQDVFVTVPGDPVQRAGIGVVQVVDDSAASAAGLLAGDVIVGIGDEVWREIPIKDKFGKQIRNLKPKSKVSLKVLRRDKLLEIEVILRRRPPIPVNPLLWDEPQANLEALSKAEQDAFFRNWLRARKLEK